MSWKLVSRLLPIIAAVLFASACGEYSPASYPGQTSMPPLEIQPLNLRLGILANAEGSFGPSVIADRMRVLALFQSVDAAGAAQGRGFDLLVDLHDMNLSSGRSATVIAAQSGRRLYTWRPSCGWNDPWCINPEKIARDIAWAFADGTSLHSELMSEIRPARGAENDSEEKAAPAPEQPAAPAEGKKPWWQ